MIFFFSTKGKEKREKGGEKAKRLSRNALSKGRAALVLGSICLVTRRGSRFLEFFVSFFSFYFFPAFFPAFLFFLESGCRGQLQAEGNQGAVFLVTAISDSPFSFFSSWPAIFPHSRLWSCSWQFQRPGNGTEGASTQATCREKKEKKRKEGNCWVPNNQKAQDREREDLHIPKHLLASPKSFIFPDDDPWQREGAAQSVSPCCSRRGERVVAGKGGAGMDRNLERERKRKKNTGRVGDKEEKGAQKKKEKGKRKKRSPPPPPLRAPAPLAPNLIRPPQGSGADRATGGRVKNKKRKKKAPRGGGKMKKEGNVWRRLGLLSKGCVLLNPCVSHTNLHTSPTARNTHFPPPFATTAQ